MISALEKISTNSGVSKANTAISSCFIADPQKLSDINWKKLDMNADTTKDNSNKKIKTSIWDSHPSIDDRIARLRNYN